MNKREQEELIDWVQANERLVAGWLANRDADLEVVFSDLRNLRDEVDKMKREYALA